MSYFRVNLLSITILLMGLSIVTSEAIMALMKSKTLSIGTPMPSFNLLGTDGTMYSQNSFSDAKALVLVITCNHCPYAQASWPVLIDLQNELKNKGVRFVAINPNDATTVPEDNYENMKALQKKLGINFPYLRDETQAIAKSLEAACTPDVYVFDQTRKLYYHGRINDNWQDRTKVTETSLKNAINDLLSGKEPPADQEPSFGCSIKWKE